MNRLSLQIAVTNGAATLRPTIDGRDFLAEYKNDEGLDPERLLPPLSYALLPTRRPRRVIVGACSCGETGCGSLSMSLRRAGNEVVWEALESARDETLRREYRFDLEQYLDAVDAAADDRPGEGRGRRIARRVRLALGLYDGEYDSLTMFHQAKVDWISAWPWDSDTVRASLTSASGQTVREFDAQPNESDDHFMARVCSVLNDLRLGRPSDG